MSAIKKKQDQDTVTFVENLKRQWMATIDAMVDPLMIIGTDFRVSKCNMAAAEIAQMDVKKLIGTKCHEVFADRETPCKGCKLTMTAETKEHNTFDLKNEKNESYYEVSSKPFYDPTGQLDGIIHVYRDRTLAKNLEGKLLQSEKLASIGLLAGGVAHEINNPLGGILIFSQMLLKEMDKDSVHYPDVVEIESATQRCKVIVERLLEFARQQPAGYEGERAEEVDVIETMITALRFGKIADNARNIEINEKWKEATFITSGNHNKLIQVFLNLLQNSFQSMPDGGEIDIDITQDKEKMYTHINITDSGVGIPENHLVKIFDPFFTTKDPGEGTGLGLSICYGIVQEMGGTMSAESTVNVGTTFKISLPTLEQKAKDETS